MGISLHSGRFLYTFVSQFSGDESYQKDSRPTPEVFYCLVNPTPTKKAQLISCSEELAEQFDIALPFVQEDVDILTGNLVTAEMSPYAIRYGGHQFGYWAGQLGDGRAINLGELVNRDGQRWDFQLKGAGVTPYSRRADGRAVLRSSVREYLMSEAMFYLGVPTTRALSLSLTGDMVVRDMFYDGNPAPEKGAVVCRVAPSFLRFGNFQILADAHEYTHLSQLIEYTIQHYYPEIDHTHDTAIVSLFEQVASRTLDMIVEWMRVGFTHGVMNTDNMSMLGLTIDYGPYSMLDNYDANFTPNTTDLPGRRYAFGKQAPVACWNLEQLADALSCVLPKGQSLNALVEGLGGMFNEKYVAMVEKKIGVPARGPETSVPLLKDLLALLQGGGFDYTLFFQELRVLRRNPFETDIVPHIDRFLLLQREPDSMVVKEQLQQFLSSYRGFLGQELWGDRSLIETMGQVNPAFILRNYQLHQAIERLERGDDSLYRELEFLMKTPYVQPPQEGYAEPVPAWAYDTPGCAFLSCSS